MYARRGILLLAAMGAMGGLAQAQELTVARLDLHLPAQSFEKVRAPEEPLVEVDRTTLDGLVKRYEDATREKDLREKEADERKRQQPPVAAIIRTMDLTGSVEPGSARIEVTATVDVLAPGVPAVELLGPGAAVESFTSSEKSDALSGHDLVASAPEEVQGNAGQSPGALGAAVQAGVATAPPSGGQGSASAAAVGQPEAPEGVSLLVSGTGERTVDLSIRVPVHEERAQRRLVIPLPGAGCQALHIRISGPVSGVKLEAQGVVPAITPTPGGGVDVSAQLGASRAAALEWTDLSGAGAVSAASRSPGEPSAGKAGPKAAPRRLVCRASTIEALGDGLVRFRSHLALSGVPAGTRRIVLMMESGVTLRDVHGEQVDRWRHAPDRPTREVCVEFLSPIEGATALDCEGDLALTPSQGGPVLTVATGRVTLPLVSVDGAFRSEGVVGVCATATNGLVFDAERSRSVTPIDPAQLPAEQTRLAPSPVLIALRYTEAHPVAVLDVQRFAAEPTVGVMIESATGLTVVAPDLAPAGAGASGVRTMTRVLLKVASMSPGHLSVSLPGGAQIVACFVDLTCTAPQCQGVESGKDVTYLIPIKRSPIVDGRFVPYPVEIAYRLPLPVRLGAWGDIDIPLPTMGARAGSITWTVYTPDGIHAYRASGSLATLEADRELWLVAWARGLFELAVGQLAALLLLCAPVVAVGLWLVRRARRLPGSADVTGAPVRSGPSLLLLPIAGALLMVLASIAVPNFKAARERGNVRACYANQKTISGALEMYNLDKNVCERDVTRILPQLVAGSYLQSIPEDPGFGSGSYTHYVESAGSGFGVTCRVHGSIQ